MEETNTVLKNSDSRLHVAVDGTSRERKAMGIGSMVISHQMWSLGKSLVLRISGWRKWSLPPSTVTKLSFSSMFLLKPNIDIIEFFICPPLNDVFLGLLQLDAAVGR